MKDTRKKQQHIHINKNTHISHIHINTNIESDCVVPTGKNSAKAIRYFYEWCTVSFIIFSSIFIHLLAFFIFLYFVLVIYTDLGKAALILHIIILLNFSYLFIYFSFISSDHLFLI